MNWRNIRLIYAREIRDQLRDRRTLFMIAVLPLLLYPLLGMSVFQLSQFVRKSEPKVLVLGAEELKTSGDLPPLFEDGHFSPKATGDPKLADWLHLEFASDDAKSPPVIEKSAVKAAKDVEDGEGNSPRAAELKHAEEELKSGDVQVVLNFPPDFEDRLHELRSEIKARAESKDGKGAEAEAGIRIPEPQLMFNSGKEKSRVAHMQVEQIVDTWKSQIVRENLLASQVPANVARPFELQPHDVAELRQQQALMWSKVLPFVLFIWALTGAFYPAVDLCAGEKERGTLETLLSSPAARTEIVWGKLFTVMTFSGATALLNLSSLGLTARYVMAQLSVMPLGDLGEGMQLPPLTSLLWLVVALIPMTALFSALCLACAAFARSTKEGQYYLMPLFLISMPLMMLPLAPGAELNLGNSLIPITGVVLLVMSLVQGDYGEALRYVLPVCAVTLICCHWAIRWAVYQFNQESVLFRESERLDPKRWLVHLIRDRRDTPSLAESFFCIVLIFVIKFFMELALAANTPAEPDFPFFMMMLFVSQVICIALPALMMALILTGSLAKTLRLASLPRASACGAAILLATLLHPFGLQLSAWIQNVYPVQEAAKDTMHVVGQMLNSAPNAWLPILLMAALPAVCEELAFRGFILSGLRHLGSKWWAIGITAFFFGLIHGFIQQSISAAALGMVLGYIVVQTGNLIPCMLFHATYNGLGLASSYWPKLAESQPGFGKLFYEAAPGQILYYWPVVVVSLLAAIGLLMWFHRLPYQATREEQISDARARQPHHPMPVGSSE
ncbi:MAG TPA: ABC transporter permease subunit/CPBP intramembrane protease [Lacipirellulaceae bacterium]|jgi:sodium transport system permease protein|nr:ABC transporter permease subunit/CPBP intramembrane protease [Lacipirellulaceae bacterium]